MRSITRNNQFQANRVRDQRQAAFNRSNAPTAGKFIGTTFISGGQIDAENKQKRDLELLNKKGANALAVQNAANKGNLDTTKVTQGAMTDRQDSINQVTIDQNQATNTLDRNKFDFKKSSYADALERQKRIDFRGREKDFTHDTFDIDGNLISKKRGDLAAFLESESLSTKAYNAMYGSKADSSIGNVKGASGNTWSMKDGRVVKTPPTQKFSNSEELRKKAPSDVKISSGLKKAAGLREPNKNYSQEGYLNQKIFNPVGEHIKRNIRKSRENIGGVSGRF